MQNRGTLWLGLALIVLGTAFLLSTLTGIDLGMICWPTGFILLGVWFIVRPFAIGPETELEQKLLGNIERSGAYTLRDQEYWLGVGEVRLDLSDAEWPPGETAIKIFGFVGSVQISLPEHIGVRVASTAFLTDAEVLGQKEERFFGTLEVASGSQEQQLCIESTWLVCDLDVTRV
jgi:predicted membrane protein